jgi:hypothetical protein
MVNTGAPGLIRTPVFDAVLAECAPTWLVEHYAPTTLPSQHQRSAQTESSATADADEGKPIRGTL